MCRVRIHNRNRTGILPKLYLPDLEKTMGREISRTIRFARSSKSDLYLMSKSNEFRKLGETRYQKLAENIRKAQELYGVIKPKVYDDVQFGVDPATKDKPTMTVAVIGKLGNAYEVIKIIEVKNKERL